MSGGELILHNQQHTAPSAHQYIGKIAQRFSLYVDLRFGGTPDTFGGPKMNFEKKRHENGKKSLRVLDHKIPPTSPILNPSTSGEPPDNLLAGVSGFLDPTNSFRGPKIR